jgi:hypothetical protein
MPAKPEPIMTSLMCFLLWFDALENPRVTVAAPHWRQRSTTKRRRATKTLASYGGEQSSIGGIGMGRSHARQLLSGRPR